MDRDDAGSGTPSDGPSTSGFQFNLDAALNELRRSRPPSLADLMRIGTDDDGGGEPASPPPGDADVPTIREATSVDDPPHPAGDLSTSWTTSLGAPSPSGGTTITPASTPVVEPAVAAPAGVVMPAPTTIAPTLPTVTAAAPAATMTSPAATGNVAVLDTPAMSATTVPTVPTVPSIPSVPAYVPAPPPVAPVPAAPMPLVTAAPRVAAKRKKRRGGLKAFLLLLLIGGVVAGALVYGRSYLFPDEWDRDLVPIADDIEATAGVEFVDAVRVDPLPAEEYDTRAATALFGAGWEQQVPTWRALGLATGEATPATFGPVLRSWSPAVYDPATGEVLRIESLGGKGREAALTEQLTAVLFDQVYGANLLVDPANPVLSRAVVAHQIELTADASTTATEPTLDRGGLDTLPSPLAYELLARADLGAPAAAKAGLTLAEDDASALAELPKAVADVLGVAPEAGAPARLVTGDVVAGDATVPDRDFWYLVFGAYLPADGAAAAADAITEATLTPATRGETVCAYATLAGVDAAANGVLQFVLSAWVAAAPAEAQASMTTFDDGTVQLVTCDPGTAPGVLPRPGVAAELVAREVALLNG